MSNKKSLQLIASATFGENKKKLLSPPLVSTKAQRLEEFKTAFGKAKPAANVLDAWIMLSTILKEVEDYHAQEEKMSIPPLEFNTTRNYGGGVCIHLIGHDLYINGNGAIRITDHLENIFCEKHAQDGSEFKRTSNWEYLHNTPEVQHLRIIRKARAHQSKLFSQATSKYLEDFNQAKAEHLKNLQGQR